MIGLLDKFCKALILRCFFHDLFSTKPLSHVFLPGQLHWNSLMSWSTLTRPRRIPTAPGFPRTLPVNLWPRPPAESKQWHLVQLVATELQYERLRLARLPMVTMGDCRINVDDRIVYGWLGLIPLMLRYFVPGSRKFPRDGLESCHIHWPKLSGEAWWCGFGHHVLCPACRGTGNQ